MKFPLFNSGNKICGYLVDGKQLNKDEFTTVKNSNGLVIFPRK
ncbi:hypothetical protein [Tenacibaculum sp. MAR_2009_124]|nr:hypothetical protein [Tenacibaculum sp. MAR_2009_124]